MSGTNVEDVKKHESLDGPPKNDVASDNNSVDDVKDSDENDGNPMPSSQKEIVVYIRQSMIRNECILEKVGVPPIIEKMVKWCVRWFRYAWRRPVEVSIRRADQMKEEAIKKKYGGLIPKKPPLISKDHERAYFDSADWALGKQGAQKPKGPLEALRPKLQPTQQHARSRRSAYAPADDSEVDGCPINTSSEDHSAAEDVGDDNSCTSQDQSSHQ
ncbi:hypothetical protein Lal_00018400 [Lupinus albus]|nr:hypothetical protein Lal_00018400 [Lupinus albus]